MANALASVDSCDSLDDCRKLSDVVLGCLATIFACIWVSVHPNVPSPGQTKPVLSWRRVKLMLIGIVAPEIMVGFAARQFLGARALSREFGFSRTHGFFFCMGGFVSSTGYPVATWQQLLGPLGPDFLQAIRNVSADDIMDKSKGDALSKGLALAQGLWFTTQCLVRAHQSLAVTQLEVATLAFAFINIFVWLLWWDKPLDVQRQIVVGPPAPPGAQPITHVAPPRVHRFAYALSGIPADHKYNPLSSTSVPSFWSIPLGAGLWAFAIAGLVGAVFGVIHCAAWNAEFPTAAERLIWRTSSAVVAGIPAVVVPTLVLLSEINETPFESTIVGRVLWKISQNVFLGAIPIYILARLILIVLPLTSLRSLPPSAFADVAWSVYLPHL